MKYSVKIFNADIVKRIRIECPNILVRTLNKVITSLRSDVSRAIRNTYTIKKSDLDSDIRVRKATPDTLIAWLFSLTKRINIIDFKATWTRKQPGTNVEIIRGNRTTIRHSFISQMKSGHRGVMMRKGSARLPIKEIKGPTVAQMMVKDSVFETVQDSALDKFNTVLAQEINYEMNKQK